MQIKKAALVKEYIDRYSDKLSKAGLGRLLFEKHPDLFSSPERARGIIRSVTKSNGNKDRKTMRTVTEWKGFSFKPEKEEYTREQVDEKRIGILSDIHLPYFDKSALESAIKSIKNFDANCIILNGDIIDCYHLSSFDKNPKNRSFKYELDILKNFFEELRSLFPKQRIIFKVGNHEERYERQILQKIPALIDLDLVSFENVIQANKYGIQVIKDKRIIKVGEKLNVIHGHELRAGIISPVNIARGFFLRTKASTLGGHHHRTSEHIEQDLNGHFIGCFSTGCLCNLTPQYMPINSHNHGFALIENYGSEFHVRNLKIINGKVL